MKTTRAIGTPRVGTAQHAPAAYPRSSTQRVAINTAPLRLQQTLAHVENLERALASSQQELIAAQRQVEIFAKANAQLRKLAVQREHGVTRSTAQHSTWKLTSHCLGDGVNSEATLQFERLLTKRIRFRDGGVLYRVGDEFKALYAICAGSCKTILLARDGREQVAGYHMLGEMIGMDGVGLNVHECQAIALEDMEVCPLPFDQIENLARLSEQFRRNLYKLLSQEFARAQTLMLVLGTMSAEQRLAAFLIDLSQRYLKRGYSSCEFVLRMTREKIGSYLGLKLETVSRLFSRFHHEGLLQVQGRTVKLLDLVALSKLVDCGT